MPRRHQAWKACNGFMYRLHVGFFSLQPFSRALQTAVFYVHVLEKLSIPKWYRLVSGGAPHEPRWCSSSKAKIFPKHFKHSTIREVISLVVKGQRVGRFTDIQVKHYICCSFVKCSLKEFTAVPVTNYRVGQESASEELADSRLVL